MTESEIQKIAELIAQKVSLTPRWLKLTAAAQYAAINKDKLKRLATAGKVTGYRETDSCRGDWIFDKESLDEYRLQPVFNNMQKARAILASV